MGFSDDETLQTPPSGGRAPTTTSLAEGDELGGYRILRLLGRGGMGEVYLAEQTRLKRQYALKLLPSELSRDESFRNRFEAEAQTLAKLDHGSIVDIVYAGSDAGRHFLVMEYVSGGSLDAYLEGQGGKLGDGEVKDILRQLLTGLDYAHGRHVVHRDLKPANLLRTQDGVLKITDFGLARVVGEDYVQSLVQKSIQLSMSGMGGRTIMGESLQGETLATGLPSSGSAAAYVGTIDYMSPEVRSGQQADIRSDLYAVGIMTYQLLTGRKPLGMAAPASTRVKGLSKKWDTFIACCLEEDPADRYQSPAEALAALSGLPVRTPYAGPAPAAPARAPSKGTGPWKAIAAVLTLCALSAIGYFATRQHDQPTPPTKEETTPPSLPTGSTVDATPSSLPTGSGVDATPSSLPSGSASRSTNPQNPESDEGVASTSGLRTSDLGPRTSPFAITVDPPDPTARLWVGPYSDFAIPDGRAELPDLPPGEHELIVQAQGYQPFTTRVTVPQGGGGAVEARLVAVRGALSVETDPGANVIAIATDGQRTSLGTADTQGKLRADNILRIGSYTLEIQKEKHKEENRTVELIAGREVRVKADLTPLPGELRVFTVPQGAEIRIGGQVRGKTSGTVKDVPAEVPQEVEVYLSGYRRVRQTVTLNPAEVRTLNLGTLTSESGAVALTVEPADLRDDPALGWSIDGRNIPSTWTNGTLTADGLEVGARQLRIAHPDYEVWTGSATVADGQTARQTVVLTPRPAKLTLSSNPAGATVTISGGQWNENRLDKVTPLVASVPPGSYTLRYTLDGYQPAERQVTLAANASEQFSQTLEKSKGPATGQPWTVPDCGIQLQWIAPGGFLMGEEGLQHRVTLTRGYWLGRYEVTQGQWEAVMGNNPSNFKSGGRNAPVEMVSWTDAMEFCRKLTERERAGGRLPAGYAYTLPTEAQWEYACRAGTTTGFSFGNDEGNLYQYGNYCDRSNTDDWAKDWRDKDHSDGHDKTAPVGSYKPNPWGLHDMHGNVWEWCSDWYGEYPSSAVTDPTGASTGTGRVGRGGGWSNGGARGCRSALRDSVGPGFRCNDLGFRLALSSVQ